MTASMPRSQVAADRAWIALRIVDVLQSHGIDAYYDNGRVHTGSETIDVSSLLPHLAAVDRGAWATSVNEYALGVVHRIVNRSHAPSSPLGRLVVRNARQPRAEPSQQPSRTLAEITGLTPRVPVSVDGHRPAVQLFSNQPSPAAVTRQQVPERAVVPQPVAVPTQSRQVVPQQPTPAPAAATVPQPAAPEPNVPQTAPTQPAPTPLEVPHSERKTAESDAPSSNDLSSAMERISVRVVSDHMIDGIPAVALGPSALPGTQTALTLGGDRWVTDDDLERWRIDAAMAQAIAESRVENTCRPDIDLVLVDATSRVFVLESDEPEVAAALAFLELHVPLRTDESALIATGGENVAIVSLGDHPTAAALNALIDSAVKEHAQRPGRLHPALYRWSPAGRLTVVADDLDTAAGRLAARAFASSPELGLALV